MSEVAVGFDFDRTLGVDHSLERRALAWLAGELGAPLDEHSAVAGAQLEAALIPFRSARVSLETMVCDFVAGLEPAPRTIDRVALTARYRSICYTLVDDVVEPVAGARELIES